MIGTVYLLHFEPAFRHAQHYLGWAVDAHTRIDEHLAGTSGVSLINAALAAGVHIEHVRSWDGVDRHFERRIKKNGTLKRVCPLCKAGHNERKRKQMRIYRQRKRQQQWG